MIKKFKKILSYFCPLCDWIIISSISLLYRPHILYTSWDTFKGWIRNDDILKNRFLSQPNSSPSLIADLFWSTETFANNIRVLNLAIHKHHYFAFSLQKIFIEYEVWISHITIPLHYTAVVLQFGVSVQPYVAFTLNRNYRHVAIHMTYEFFVFFQSWKNHNGFEYFSGRYNYEICHRPRPYNSEQTQTFVHRTRYRLPLISITHSPVS